MDITHSEPSSFLCGFVAIIGRPNVGKSTLLNRLIGSKISIVSRKAQTTRHRIHGVLTDEHAQMIFVDTPGFQTKHAGAMNKMMNRVVTQALNDIDVVIHVIEAGKWTDADQQVYDLIPDRKKAILVINKVDRLKAKNDLFPFVAQITNTHEYAAVVPVSAEKNKQLDKVLHEVTHLLPQGQAVFEEDALTDRPVRFIAAELIREKIFRLVGDELPYASTVVIEQWEELPNHVRIAACILVEREGHKPILLGAKGLHMKRIASEARQEMSLMLDKSVHLEIYVKVRKGWSERESSLRDLGYE